MRPEAEVDPVAVPVEGERLRARGRRCPCTISTLYFSPMPSKRREGLVHRDLVADEGQVGLDGLVGRLLDLLEVLRREGRLAREVVVEAVLDRRADGDLGARVELLHHARHHVRRVVARHLERLRAPGGDDLELRVAVELAREVDRLRRRASRSRRPWRGRRRSRSSRSRGRSCPAAPPSGCRRGASPSRGRTWRHAYLRSREKASTGSARARRAPIKRGTAIGNSPLAAAGPVRLELPTVYRVKPTVPGADLVAYDCIGSQEVPAAQADRSVRGVPRAAVQPDAPGAR